MQSSDRARLAHRMHVWKFPRVQMFTQKFMCSKFHVLVVSRENCENLDLTKSPAIRYHTGHNRYCNQPMSHLNCCAACKKKKLVEKLVAQLRDRAHQVHHTLWVWSGWEVAIMSHVPDFLVCTTAPPNSWVVTTSFVTSWKRGSQQMCTQFPSEVC